MCISVPVPCITPNPIVCFSGETFFHGSNAVVKGPPWIPSRDGFDPLTSLTAKERLTAWNEKPWIAPWIAMVINSQYEWLIMAIGVEWSAIFSRHDFCRKSFFQSSKFSEKPQ